MGILESFYSLGGKVNKVRGKGADLETEEGLVSDKLPELTLEMSNEDLVKLTENWEKEWNESDVFSDWDKACQENEDYWKGKQYDYPKFAKVRPLVDNVIFESLETYLPQVTRRNPDPTVALAQKVEQTEENIKYAVDIQKELAEIADEVVLRLKLKKAGRHWALYLLGALKPGWDLNKDIPTVKVIRPKKLILDPSATVDEEGYTGERLGEYRKMQAGKLLDTLNELGGEEEGIKKIEEIISEKKGEEARGSELQFIEWWTNEYVCWKMDKTILLKKRNPHWNYDSEKEAPYNTDGTPQMNAEGKPVMESIPGFNHFSNPKMPYILLSVFSLGKQPVDETSLIGQNLSPQDVVNKRIKQIDKNADSMNGGMVVSLERSGLNQGQARKVSDALRNGGTVTIPSGSVQDAIVRMSAPSLPADVYNQAIDMRNRIRDVFGTRGSSAAGLDSERTVRGKIQLRMLDTDRIGGGFSEYLEQMADSVYNWFVQLLYVYDDRYAAKTHPKIRVSVKEGSLLPKDSLTLANQAIELAGQGRMSLIDLYKALDYPNPEELAANAWLEVNAPETLYQNDPRIAQVIEARRTAAGDKGPSKSINFKDLPPEGQAQLAKQAGIELNPEAIAAHEEFKDNKEIERSNPMPALPNVAGTV